MSYVVLARKWRPQSFDDLAGQGHVSTTLENAIAKGRVAHAFLFTGVRGVGKTTSARILAKCLNCVNGPTAHPCQVCPQCVEITAGQDMDVQEIDGASYNGVDEVRRLQETLPYRPARDRFKIFIVDEVHMLSNAAWNAFLKTLEEPPPHVKFIFATTEVHKVPVTILSRCQRYDFKLISASTIAARLKFVLEQEGAAFDDAAVHVVAREAAGSMRDAMSLLDQVLASVGGGAGERLTAEGVARVLGVADRVVLHKLAGAVVSGDASSCIAIVKSLAEEGYDLPHVARDFLAELRDVVVAKVAEDPSKLLDLAAEEIADVKALADRADVDDLARIHQGFSRAFDDITKGGQPRQALEMTLVRLARRPPLLPVEELLKRLGDLERRLGGGSAGPGGAGPGGGPRGGAPPARRPGPPAGPTAAPVSNAAPPQRSVDPAPQAPRAADRPLDPAPDGSRAPDRPVDPVPNAPFAANRAVDPAANAPWGADRAVDPVPQAPRAADRPTDQARPAPRGVTGAPREVFRAPEPRPQPPPAPPRAEDPAPLPERPAVPAAPEALSVWRAVIARVRARRPALASVLEHAALVAIGPERVALGYEAGSFLVGQATEPAARELLSTEVAAHFGHAVDVAFETLPRGHGVATIAQVEGAERKERVDAARRAVEAHPLVTAAITMLGAELKDVRLAEVLEA